jgi:uncharacterized protein (DUF1800 family)
MSNPMTHPSSSTLRHWLPALAWLLAACGGDNGGSTIDAGDGGALTPDATETDATQVDPNDATDADQPTIDAALPDGFESELDTDVADDVYTPSSLPGNDVFFDDIASAARFLNMATFGATRADAEHLVEVGLDRWFVEQLAMSSCTHQDPELARPGGNEEALLRRAALRHQIWFTNVMECPAQLRQRVGFALSNIFVVSEISVLFLHQDSLAAYSELLERDGLGEFEQLLYNVSRSPTMGTYLNLIGNSKAIPALGIRPDENFAREVQQLFTIGLVELNLDGTPQLDVTGDPIPTYTQDGIEAFSRAFTGWAWNGVTTIAEFLDAGERYEEQDYVRPMSPVDELHDTEEKELFPGVTLPARQSAEEDFAQALGILANHPNVGPFIGRQLIQRLVTSNPSPAYVARVATIFNDNGMGERGDMYAVIRAVLADEEALSGRSPAPYEFGRLREPLVRVTHLWRTFDATATDTENDGHAFAYITDFIDLGQSILSAPSVFNFFFPDYSPPGPVADAGLVGPEFQILNETYMARTANAIGTMALLGYEGSPNAWLLGEIISARLDYRYAVELLDDNEDAFLDYLDALLMGGTISRDMRRVLSQNIATARFGRLTSLQIVAEVVHVVVLSPQYVVQR